MDVRSVCLSKAYQRRLRLPGRASRQKQLVFDPAVEQAAWRELLEELAPGRTIRRE